MSVSDEEQRMLIVLVALNKVVAPVLQQFTKQGMDNHYTFLDKQLSTLKPACSLSTLTYVSVTSDPNLKLLIKPLEFGNINSNFDTHGHAKNLYDYKVNSSIDLAKLYLPTYLAQFSAFDKSLDVSAILRLLGVKSPAPLFPSSHPVICVQTIADDVRTTVRNKGAHFNECEWTETFFQECFAKMETLVKSMVLPVAIEKTTLDELSKWKNQGFKLIVQRDVRDLFEEFIKTKMEDEVKTKFCKLLQKMPSERMVTERFDAVEKVLQHIAEEMKEIKTANQLNGTVCEAIAQILRNGGPHSTTNTVPVDSTSAEKCKPKDEASVEELSQGSIGVIPGNCSNSVEVGLVNGACSKVSILDGSNSVSRLTTKIVPLDFTSAEVCKPKDEEGNDELSVKDQKTACCFVEVGLVNGACPKVSIPDGSNSVSLLTSKTVPLDSTSAEICKPKDEEISDELSQGSTGERSGNCSNSVEEDLAKDPSALQSDGCPKIIGINPNIVNLKRPPVPFLISFDGTLPDNVKSGTAEFVNLEHVPVTKDDDCLFGRAVPTSPREGVFKVRVYSQDNSFLGETEIVYLDIIEEVLAQAMKSRPIMAKFLEATLRHLKGDSEGIIGNTQESSKVGFSSEWKSSLSVQLLQRLVYTAAKVDALWLIQIIFNLPAGRIVFDSYRSRSLLPEYVAIANGHMEIAQYLQDVNKRFSTTQGASELQSSSIDWQEIIAAIKETQDQPIPQEIQAQGHKAEAAFKKAMEKGSVEVYRGRIMLIGQDRAGKTSLKKFLLGIPFDPEEESTVGIKVDAAKFEVEIDQVKNWQVVDYKKLDLSEYREDIARITAEHMKALEGESQETTDSMDLEQDIKDPSRLHDVNVLPKIEEDAEGFEQSDASPTIAESASDSNHSRKAEIDPSTSNLQQNDMQADQDIQLIDVTAGLTLDDVAEKVEQCLQGLKLNDNVKAKEINLSVWDFAGQNLYYASHSVFLSHRAVYLLVHNLSKDLNAPAKPSAKLDTRKIELENPSNQTNLDILLSWLVSVHCIRPTRDETSKVCEEKEEKEGKCPPYRRPPVFVVGTHADKPFKDIRDTLQYIQDSISGKRYDEHVIRPLYAIDNTRSVSDYGIQALQNRISEALKHEPYMGEKVPIRWFHFEKVVEALVEKKIYHMELNELLKCTKRFCHIDKEDEFETMLKFYHDLGVIVKHGRTVVLQALWLIDVFKQLINVRPYDEREPRYAGCWQELKEKGILRMDLIDHVFTDFIQKDISKQDILKMMEDHGLIAKFSFLPADGDHQQEYFVPSLLKSLPFSLYEIQSSNCDPCPLYLHFLDGFVPHGLFAQLVSRCIVWCSGYSPQIPELFQNGAMFFLIGKQRIFDLVLICKKRFIKIILTQNPHASPPSTTYSAAKAREVRIFLEGTLKDMREELCWLDNLRYELCAACTYCLNGPHQCIRHSSVRCADDDCLHLLPLRSEEQLTSWENCVREPIKIYGLEKWLLVHEKESEERKMVSGNPKGPAVKRQRLLLARSLTPRKLMRPVGKRQRESPGSSCVKHPRRTHPVKEGSPENDVLERLANQIINEWKKLGRRLLENDETLLDAVDKENDECSEKAYKMLLKWKAAKGSDATFRVLHDALCHDIVDRRDLAEEICLVTEY